MSFSDRPHKTLVLFDVDGTLTPARQVSNLGSISPLSVNNLFPIGCLVGDDRGSPCPQKEGRHWLRRRVRSCQDHRATIIRGQQRSVLTSSTSTSHSNHHKAIDDFDYAFAENGLTAYKLGKQLESQSFIKFIGEDRYKALVNFILHYIADMDIPIKR